MDQNAMAIVAIFWNTVTTIWKMLFLLAVQIAQNFKFAEHVLLSIFSNMKNQLLEIATYAFVIFYLYFVEYPWFTKYRVFPNEGYTELSYKMLFFWSKVVIFGFLAFATSLRFVLCSLYRFSQQNCIQFKHFYILSRIHFRSISITFVLFLKINSPEYSQFLFRFT